MSTTGTHRYILEPYKGTRTRYECPACGAKRQFSRYIDIENDNNHLADHVGKCNREGSCTYHYTPKQFFADNPNAKPQGNGYTGYNEYQRPAAPQPPKQKVNMPSVLLKRSIERDSRNNHFIAFLLSLFEPCIVNNLTIDYSIGTADGAPWWFNDTQMGTGAAVVFWFVNVRGEVRSGQVKLFDTTGHTAKWLTTEGEKLSCTGWVHDILAKGYIKANSALPEWLTMYRNQDIYTDCLFGENLINLPENKEKPIAIVEAPKTAIIASVFLPQYVWIAAGSLSYLTPERCAVLQGRKVVLFPDLGKVVNKEEDAAKAGWELNKSRTYNIWKQQGQELSHIAAFMTSDILEHGATEEQRIKGYDLADFLTSEQARRELTDNYKHEILDRDPGTQSEVHEIWLKYRAIGLRRQDQLLAHQELQQVIAA